MYHFSLNDNQYNEYLDFQNDLLDEKSSNNNLLLNADSFNIIPINNLSEEYFLDSPKILPSGHFSFNEGLFSKVREEVSNTDEEKKSQSKNKSMFSSSSKQSSIQKKENSSSKLFQIYKDEIKRKEKEKIEKNIEKKENNYINEKRERERENKTKRGRRNSAKKRKEHTGKDFDNMLVKIQNHYLSFLIKFSNDVSASVLGDEYKYIFKNIDRSCKINIKYDYLNRIKSEPIENILKLDINNKYQYYNKNNNSESFDKLCKESKWLKNKYFKMNYLDLFNYYYNKGNILKEVNIEGKNISLSKNTETFYHLKGKCKDQEESLMNAVKLAYFNGYDGLNPDITFKTLKKEINNE